MGPDAPSLLRAAPRGPWNLRALPGALPHSTCPRPPCRELTEPDCQWPLSLRAHPAQLHQGLASRCDSQDTEGETWRACAQSCPTLRPHGLSPARPLCPWKLPGKNTGVGYHVLLQGCWILKFRYDRNHNRKHMCLPQQAVSYDGQRQGPAPISIHSKWINNHKLTH